MFRNLKIGRKLVLLGIVFSVPVVVLLFLLIKEQNIAIDFGQNERRGVEYIKPVRQLLHNIQKHQVAFLNGAAETSVLADRGGYSIGPGGGWSLRKRIENNPRPCWVSGKMGYDKILDSP